MLITRPNHDPATNYLYFWSQELIYQAKKQNIQKLTLSSATKEDAELIPYLTWNYLHQVCLGNIEATI